MTGITYPRWMCPPPDTHTSGVEGWHQGIAKRVFYQSGCVKATPAENEMPSSGKDAEEKRNTRRTSSNSQLHFTQEQFLKRDKRAQQRVREICVQDPQAWLPTLLFLSASTSRAQLHSKLINSARASAAEPESQVEGCRAPQPSLPRSPEPREAGSA